MNKKGPPDNYKFKKGQSGNPSGRPKLLQELLGIRELTSEELKRRIAKYMRMTLTHIEAVLMDPENIAIDLIIASALQKAIKEGDIAKAECLFNRALGRVKETMEVVQPEPIIIMRKDGSQVELGIAVEEDHE